MDFEEEGVVQEEGEGRVSLGFVSSLWESVCVSSRVETRLGSVLAWEKKPEWGRVGYSWAGLEGIRRIERSDTSFELVEVRRIQKTTR